MYVCTGEPTAPAAFTKMLCSAMQDVKMGLDLTADYVDLYPFGGQTLPPQTYTFTIQASITDGQSLSETFTWELNDPCLEAILTLVSPVQTFMDDYTGTTQNWMPTQSVTNNDARCDDRIVYTCESVTAPGTYLKTLCTASQDAVSYTHLTLPTICSV